MELDHRQKRIIAAIDAAAECIWSVSHQIHDRPELGYQEMFASSLLVETLESFGFNVEMGFAGMTTAFRARKGQGGGPRVAFLAEYDALPDIGHGCGHNIIATTALAAGIGLGAVVEELAGEVWVVGTPAEETDGAKVHMVNQGIFNDVDAALMVHPHMGSYMLTESLAMDAIQVEFFGKASHAAAAPWEGINALDAILLTFNNINALRQQIRPDARIHGVIVKGGVAPNIIPDHTIARFYVRAKQRAYLNELVDKFKACAQAAAQATGARVEFSNYESSFDDMLNNLSLAQRMRDYLEDVLGSQKLQRAPSHFGSVDMGNVSHVAPGVHILFDISDGQVISPHTHEFCASAVTPYADAALVRAGKALALTGYDVIHDSEFHRAVKAEFATTLGHTPARENSVD
jgi:amidohydrolase